MHERDTPWPLPGAGADPQTPPIFGNTHHPADGVTPRGVLVCCHGFKGYKDYGFLPRLAQHAADAGLIAHRFNFSHSGMTDEIETFARPDLFEQDTWAKRVRDIIRVIDEVASAPGLPVVLFGHSNGGLASLLAAAQLGDRLAGVVTAASPADACLLDESQRGLLRRTGRLASPSGRTGQNLYVGRAWLEEIESDPPRFDPVLAVARIPGPVLLLHGDDDATIPVEAVHRLHAAAAHQQARVIQGASHTFNAPNPLPLDTPLPPPTAELLDGTLDFARRCVQSAAG